MAFCNAWERAFVESPAIISDAPVWNRRLDDLDRREEFFRKELRVPLPDGEFDLPLSQWAPADWDGILWVGVALQEAGPHAEISLKLR